MTPRADIETVLAALDEHEKEELKVAKADTKLTKRGGKKKSAYMDDSDDDWDAPKKKKTKKKARLHPPIT